MTSFSQRIWSPSNPGRFRAQRERITDVIPLCNIEMLLTISGDVTAVRLEPQGESLVFQRKGDEIKFSVPRLEGRQLVVIAR